MFSDGPWGHLASQSQCIVSKRKVGFCSFIRPPLFSDTGDPMTLSPPAVSLLKAFWFHSSFSADYCTWQGIMQDHEAAVYLREELIPPRCGALKIAMEMNAWTCSRTESPVVREAVLMNTDWASEASNNLGIRCHPIHNLLSLSLYINMHFFSLDVFLGGCCSSQWSSVIKRQESARSWRSLFNPCCSHKWPLWRKLKAYLYFVFQPERHKLQHRGVKQSIFQHDIWTRQIYIE